MENDWTLLSTWFSERFSGILTVSWLTRIFFGNGFYHIPKILAFERTKKKKKKKSMNVEKEKKLSLLDLPELTLECILERLSPAELCAMASVCTDLRDRCRSDHLWEKHMKKKWGRLMGDAAFREWQSHESLKKVCPRGSDRNKPKGNFRFLHSVPFSWICSKARSSNNGSDKRITTCSDTNMSWYLSLENGKFWFPAQVYNRENGHVGFILSCYDAKLCYDSKTDTFRARYSPHGWRMIEENITWDRLRPPPVGTPSGVLHVSNCLQDLKPGDHIEIQWRRNKEFPYGWWYGVIGHLESCEGNQRNCCCHCNDILVLEFRQFKPSSPWRQTTINRRNHREMGDEADGFYGGIRKLDEQDEISTWKHLWPTQVLE